MKAMNRSNTPPRSLVLILATSVTTAVVTLLALYAAGVLVIPSRQAEVAARGAAVMPFDLDKTRHIFQQQPDGGVQQVVALDPSDTTQIALIREHVQEEALKFQRGDFGDPADIHGSSMPGLAELRESAGKITVAYTELPEGAKIQYSTSDRELVAALHQWFEAQVSDHGRHATDK